MICVKNAVNGASKYRLQTFLKVPLIGFVLLWPLLASAGGLDLLDRFLKNTQSGKAQFSQTVTSPAKSDGDGKSSQKVRKSSGDFAFQRPQLFLFSYAPPIDQILLADGQTLWTVDQGLAQATSRPQATALATTPTALIATATGIAQLEKEFTLKEESSPESGPQWVTATPKRAEGSVVRFRVALQASKDGVTLAELEILDAFGQTSRLVFSQFQINPTLDRSMFRIKLPAGVEVNRL
jgi:outer membrane lipoprotein carrier protein